MDWFLIEDNPGPSLLLKCGLWLTQSTRPQHCWKGLYTYNWRFDKTFVNKIFRFEVKQSANYGTQAWNSFFSFNQTGRALPPQLTVCMRSQALSYMDPSSSYVYGFSFGQLLPVRPLITIVCLVFHRSICRAGLGLMRGGSLENGRQVLGLASDRQRRKLEVTAGWGLETVLVATIW